MAEKVTKLALSSRIIVLILQLLADISLPDHKPNVFRAPMQHEILNNGTEIPLKLSWLDKTVHFCLGGLRHWDGEYFMHIAENSYTYENTLAFFPLYPLVVGKIASALHYLGLGLALHSWILLVAVSLNIYLFCKTANVLYALTLRVYNDAHRSWYAAMLFCFNPASIFFSAVYSETFYAFLTFSLMLECVGERRGLRMACWLALSIVTRSNGLTNMGFVIYFLLRHMLLHTGQAFGTLLKMIFALLCGLLPLSIYYHYAFRFYCQEEAVAHDAHIVEYAKARNYILAGPRQPGNSPWCEASFPNPYAYIQSYYWNVGFMRYYEFKQLPNFLLALPTLGFLLRRCTSHLRHILFGVPREYTLQQRIKEYKCLPFVLHALVLSCFCALFVHIQVSTRLLCAATPCIYWFGAAYFDKPLDQIRLRSIPGMILLWFTSYAFVGTILFSNNLPWT